MSESKPEAQDFVSFASGLAHDLNNMFLVLQGCLDLLRLSGTGGSDAMVLENMQRGITEGTNLSRRLGEVCKKCLDRTALSFGDIETAVLDINKIVRCAADLVIIKAARTGVEIDLELEPGLWPVRGHELGLKRLLLNLIENAYGALYPGSGVIRVSTRNICRPYGRQVCLAVQDTGVGMEPSMVEKIFTPGFTTKPDAGGHGLGLLVVKSIAERHRSHIEVDSVPGQGTEVRVYFPVFEEQQTANL